MIKLLALDVDNTLVGRGVPISENNCRAIAKARACGVRIVIATGRGFQGTRNVREQLHLTDAMINYAGSLVINCATQELLQARYLTEEETRTCIQVADTLGLHVQIYDGDTVIFRKRNEFTFHYIKYLGLPFIENPDFPDGDLSSVPKVLMVTHPDRVQEMVPVVQSMLPNTLSVLTSQPGFLEICSNNATKGEALKWVSQYYGLKREEVAAIGDNTLDLSMIEWAGIGCCVSNGSDLVKSRADRILPSCSEDGVAWFIEREILPQYH